MTRVKLCGMMRPEDIQAVNEIKPEYIGFVFAKKSRRYVSKEQAKMLKEMLDPAVKAVGVFVNEPVENVADLLNEGIVDMAQLHGVEDEAYICRLRELTGRGEDTFIIKAVQVKSEADVKAGEQSGADLVLFDAGAGDGKVFNWKLLENVKRPYFLAGGLDPENVRDAVERLRPFGVDVSSGIESFGVKDALKMAKFVATVQRFSVRNGLTYYLSLSTGFRHAPVRLYRTTSATFGQLRSRCGQLTSKMTACVYKE